MSPSGHLLYALAWLSFGALHSWLAGDRARSLLRPLLGRRYRLAYNLFAAVHLAAVAAVGAAVDGGTGFALPAAAELALRGMALAGLAVLVLAARDYDLGRFAGTAQLRGETADDDGPFRIGRWHRYVRHPLYLGAFLLLWGLVDGPLGLATAVWGSAYLLVGTVLEERRLLRRYGAAYAEFRRRVPAFLPWRGRAL